MCLFRRMVCLKIVADVVSHVNHQKPPPLPLSCAQVTQPFSYDDVVNGSVRES